MNHYNGNVNQKRGLKKISLSFDDILKLIRLKSENAQITFWHKFIYQHDNMKVLMSIHRKLTQKLSYLGLINIAPSDVRYDDDSIEVIEETIKKK